MTVESDADRLAMLEDFGEPVILRRKAEGGAGVEFLGLVDRKTERGFSAARFGSTAPVSMRSTVLHVRDSDFDGVEDGDQIDLRGIEFKVRTIEPDGSGMSRIVLEKND